MQYSPLSLDETFFPASVADLIIVSVILGYVLSKHLPPAKQLWFKATSERVAKTSDVLSQIKIVKMMGLEKVVRNALQQMREHEIEVSKKSRVWLITFLFVGKCSAVVKITSKADDFKVRCAIA